VIRAAADDAGRPMPGLSARVRVHLGASGAADGYAMRGTPDDVAAEVRAFSALGVGHLALAFPTLDPDGLAREAEAFFREVAPLVKG
jgi:alkanesulfonate monooxygenase SsuD/methylene tetrahydromethanopterin reductase-like flavin-dependent oxidoreductase (luciferase family)